MCPGLITTLNARRFLTVPLCRLFDRWGRLAQVLRSHHWVGLYVRVKPEKKGFGYSWELGGIAHVNDDVSAPCTIHVREVRRLGLDLLEDGLDGLAEAPVSGQCVPPLCGDAERDHEAHLHSSFPPSLGADRYVHGEHGANHRPTHEPYASFMRKSRLIRVKHHALN